jgi:hypothetical protein
MSRSCGPGSRPDCSWPSRRCLLAARPETSRTPRGAAVVRTSRRTPRRRRRRRRPRTAAARRRLQSTRCSRQRVLPACGPARPCVGSGHRQTPGPCGVRRRERSYRCPRLRRARSCPNRCCRRQRAPRRGVPELPRAGSSRPATTSTASRLSACRTGSTLIIYHVGLTICNSAGGVVSLGASLTAD